jgi:hypothetical protein
MKKSGIIRTPDGDTWHDPDKEILAAIKAKSYKGKPQLLSTGKVFKCACGKIRKDGLLKPMIDGDICGGIACSTFWCVKCGKGWNIDYVITKRPKVRKR